MAGIPEGGFKNGEQLEAWLNGQPVETRMSFAPIITIRSALRVLPFVIRYFFNESHDDNSGKSLILILFRIVTLSKCEITNLEFREYQRELAYSANASGEARRYLDRNSFLDVFSVINSAILAAETNRAAFFTSADCGALAAATVFAAAKAAANIVEIKSTTKAINFIESIEDAVNTHVTYAPVAIWKSITTDARALVAFSPKILLSAPLWPDGAPDFWQGFERDFRRVLTEQHIWSVWLEWWQARVDGTPSWGLPPALEQEVETRIALGGGRKDFWDRDPAVVNAEIAEWVAEAKKAPKPDKSLGQFFIEALHQRAAPMSINEIREAFNRANYKFIDSTLRRTLGYYANHKIINRVS